MTQPVFPTSCHMLSRRKVLQIAAGLAASWISAISPSLESPIQARSDALYRVAIGESTNYDLQGIADQLHAMFEGLGGIGSIIRRGDKVVIKVNLTGGVDLSTSMFPIVAASDYMTHPAVVQAFGMLARDAGAQELYIVESPFDNLSFSSFGYAEIAEDLDATLIDLNDPYPYRAFEKVPVGDDAYVYNHFMMHRILREADVFVSIAKMKCHSSCGVTLSMKNLVGLLPVSYYRTDPSHNWRSALHGDFDPQRIPRVVVDLNRARPIDIAIIDRISTIEGGELPRGNFAPIAPGVILAGQNALATDAVATAIMGFNPTANYPDAPFLNGENHLKLAHERQLGTHLLEEIDVQGTPIQEVRQQFRPAVAVTE